MLFLNNLNIILRVSFAILKPFFVALPVPTPSLENYFCPPPWTIFYYPLPEQKFECFPWSSQLSIRSHPRVRPQVDPLVPLGGPRQEHPDGGRALDAEGGAGLLLGAVHRGDHDVLIPACKTEVQVDLDPTQLYTGYSLCPSFSNSFFAHQCFFFHARCYPLSCEKRIKLCMDCVVSTSEKVCSTLRICMNKKNTVTCKYP